MKSIQPGEVDLETALEKILPKQKEFIQSPFKHTSYVGGEGSGKTVVGCVKKILEGRKYPGSLILIGRKNIPALRDTTMKTFLELFPEEWLEGGVRNGWKKAENRIIMSNGPGKLPTEFMFRHLDLTDPAHVAHIRSLNLSSFLVDEAAEIDDKTFYTLAGRLRRRMVPRRTGDIVGNPAGQNWFWRIFYNPERSDRYRKLAYGITASSYENYHLPEDYLEDREALYPEDWKQRFIYASFSDFSDLVYKDWDHNIHVYDSNRTHEIFGGSTMPPLDWPVIVGIDIGGVDPWAIVFIACHPYLPFMFVFAEIYQSGILVRDIAEEYNGIMKGRNLEGIAYDYENQQAALELEEEGISGIPAIKKILPGIFKMGQYLHPDPRLEHPFLHTHPSPRLMISNECTNFIREHSAWKWAETSHGVITGLPIDRENHTCDAVRYAIHTFRPDPSSMPVLPRYEQDDVDLLSKMYWRDVARHKARRKKKPRKYITIHRTFH